LCWCALARLVAVSAGRVGVMSNWLRSCWTLQTSFTMLMGIDGMNNGINYDPMNPMNQHSWSKDRKAANRIAGLVTK